MPAVYFPCLYAHVQRHTWSIRYAAAVFSEPIPPVPRNLTPCLLMHPSPLLRATEFPKVQVDSFHGLQYQCIDQRTSHVLDRSILHSRQRRNPQCQREWLARGGKTNEDISLYNSHYGRFHTNDHYTCAWTYMINGVEFPSVLEYKNLVF